jgi:hypothetical protein
MDNHHPMSLFKREEDIFLFLHIFDSPALDVLIPRVTRAILFKRFDDEIPEHRKKRQMNFYKSCIRRHLYVYGRGKCYLSKSPPNTPRIKTLQSTFPGCRFILTLRDPFYCIASAISVIKQFRANFLLPSDDQKVVPAHLAMADLFYYYSLIECSELRGKQLYVVTFNEITKDAPHTLRNLYDHLGIEFTNEFERFLLDSTDFIHEHKTNHNYKPEDYGLLPEVIRKRYDYVYREFPDLKG